MSALNNTFVLELARAFEVELTLQQGQLKGAQAKSIGVDFNLMPPMWFFYIPQLTPIKLLLAQGSAMDLDQALERLAEFDEFLRAAHRKTVRIGVLALQALVYDARGEPSIALQNVSTALSLAVVGGNLRSFLDLGQPMAELLKRLPKQDANSAFAEQILAAFEQDGARSVTGDGAGLDLLDAALIEPLTRREQDILSLLSQRFQNKEIASRLFVSPETVKSHLKHLYQKLGVNNRRDAARKAMSILQSTQSSVR